MQRALRRAVALGPAAALAAMPAIAREAPQIQRVRILAEQGAHAIVVGDRARSAAQAAPSSPAGFPASAAEGGAGTTIARVEIHIHQQPGQSGQDLAREIRAELERIERDRRAARRSSMFDSPDGADL